MPPLCIIFFFFTQSTQNQIQCKSMQVFQLLPQDLKVCRFLSKVQTLWWFGQIPSPVAFFILVISGLLLFFFTFIQSEMDSMIHSFIVYDNSISFWPGHSSDAILFRIALLVATLEAPSPVQHVSPPQLHLSHFFTLFISFFIGLSHKCLLRLLHCALKGFGIDAKWHVFHFIAHFVHFFAATICTSFAHYSLSYVHVKDA